MVGDLVAAKAPIHNVLERFAPLGRAASVQDKDDEAELGKGLLADDPAQPTPHEGVRNVDELGAAVDVLDDGIFPAWIEIDRLVECPMQIGLTVRRLDGEHLGALPS